MRVTPPSGADDRPNCRPQRIANPSRGSLITVPRRARPAVAAGITTADVTCSIGRRQCDRRVRRFSCRWSSSSHREDTENVRVSTTLQRDRRPISLVVDRSASKILQPYVRKPLFSTIFSEEYFDAGIIHTTNISGINSPYHTMYASLLENTQLFRIVMGKDSTPVYRHERYLSISFI